MRTKIKQKGAVLAVGLMMLLILTIMVISSNGSTLLQEKMSSALLEGQMSLQAVESGVKDAQAYIDTLATLTSFNDTGTGGLYAEGKGPTIDGLFSSAVWTTANSRTSSSYSMQGKNYTSQYFIESLGVMALPDENMDGFNVVGYGQTTGGGDVNAFRAVVRTTGGSGNTERIVEVQFGRRL